MAHDPDYITNAMKEVIKKIWSMPAPEPTIEALATLDAIHKAVITAKNNKDEKKKDKA